MNGQEVKAELDAYYDGMAKAREPDAMQIAKVCHEVNRVYCNSIGDFSQLAWGEAPSWQQDSIILVVKAYLADPSMTAQQSHALWLSHKRSEGWEYGAEKDVALKQHPRCVPYDMLPAHQRVKDYLFKAVVDAFL